MKTQSKNLSNKLIVGFLFQFFICCVVLASGQPKNKTILFDLSHGQNSKNAETFKGLLPENKGETLALNETEITQATLQGSDALIIFSPVKPFESAEKQAIEDYLRLGGSLLLIFDEEQRMKLQEVGVNDFVVPFGIEYTGDVPARHNCGAIAEKSKICKGKRELPYSGGRSIKGGKAISRVYDNGNYIHCAWEKLPKGGKIIMMSDGMAGLLLGKPDGVRFSGTGTSDSKYWGKDSRLFMQEILAFLTK